MIKKKSINKISPCIGICVLDIDTDFCIGCLRSSKEIAIWSQIDDKKARHIMKEIKNNNYKTLVLGVTMLTSLDESEMKEIGYLQQG